VPNLKIACLPKSLQSYSSSKKNESLFTISTQNYTLSQLSGIIDYSVPNQEKIENVLFILGFLDAQELDKKSYASILLFQGFVIQIFRSTSWHNSTSN
jgi:hypothetical protein